MALDEIREEIAFLASAGVTLYQVSEELTYRENATSDCKWDDDLYSYTTEELEEIEQCWRAVY